MRLVLSHTRCQIIGLGVGVAVKTNDSTTAGIVRRLDKWLPLGDRGFSECVTAIQARTQPVCLLSKQPVDICLSSLVGLPVCLR